MTPVVAAGLLHTDALWFALAVENAAALHYPENEVPPIIREKLQQLRTAAEAFAKTADYVGALLVAEGVEGVSTRTTEITLECEDENDDDAEPWRG